MSISIDFGGRIVAEFPDDTPEDIIDSVVQRDFVQPQQYPINIAAAPPTTANDITPWEQQVQGYNPVGMFKKVAPQAPPMVVGEDRSELRPQKVSYKGTPLYEQGLRAQMQGVEPFELFKKSYPLIAREIDEEGMPPIGVLGNYAAPYMKELSGAGHWVMKGINEGFSVMAKGLDGAADYIASKTGLDKGGIFENGAKILDEGTEYWKKEAEKDGSGAVAKFFGELAGSAGPGIADFSMGTLMYALKGAGEAEKQGENEVIGAVTGAMKRGVLGKVFHNINKTSVLPRMGLTGAVFGEQAKSEGGSPEDVRKARLSGLAFGTAGGGKVTPREMVGNAKDLGREVMGNVREMDTKPSSVIGSEVGVIGNMAPALKVGENIYQVDMDAAGTHGDAYNKIPPKEMKLVDEGKLPIKAGYVDREGKWSDTGKVEEVSANGKREEGKGKEQGERGEVLEDPQTTLGMGLGGGTDMLQGLSRWLSPTAEMVKNKGEAVMPAEEWSKRISAWGEKNPHVKDENQWNGVTAWLEGRKGEKVTREEMDGFLEASKPGWAKWEQVAGAMEGREKELRNISMERELTPGEKQELKMAEEGWLDAPQDQWANRNIPGGVPGSEKVFILQIPSKVDTSFMSRHEEYMANIKKVNKIEKYYNEKHPKKDGQDFFEWTLSNINKLETTNPEYMAIKNKMADLSKEGAKFEGGRVDGIKAEPYSSPHFENIDNVVLHMRTQEIMDKSGEKGLLAETIQSDWHQERGSKSTPPPAPFERTWHEVGVKKLIDMAAQDPSIKWVGWSSGKVQNDRWGKTNDQRQYTIMGETFDSPDQAYDFIDTAFNSEGITKKQLKQYEKEISDQFDSYEAGKGIDSNSFLNTLYNKRLPKFAKKYAEKIGGSYQTSSIAEKHTPIPEEGKDTSDQYDIYKIILPSSAKEKVNMEGQTLYSGVDVTKLGDIVRNFKDAFDPQWEGTTSNTAKAIREATLKEIGREDRVLPASEWAKRISFLQEKDRGVREENRWSGVLPLLQSRPGDKLSTVEITDWYEAVKGQNIEKVVQTGTYGEMDTMDGENGRTIIIKVKDRAVKELEKVQEGYLKALAGEMGLGKWVKERNWDMEKINGKVYSKYLSAKDKGENTEVMDGLVDQYLSWGKIHHYFTGHTNIPGTLGYVRIQDVDLGDGKKTLMVENVQSDIFQHMEAETSLAKKRGELIKNPKIKETVESLPLSKTWEQFLFKQALDEAVKGGYDQVGIYDAISMGKKWGTEPMGKYNDVIKFGRKYLEKNGGEVETREESMQNRLSERELELAYENAYEADYNAAMEDAKVQFKTANKREMTHKEFEKTRRLLNDEQFGEDYDEYLPNNSLSIATIFSLSPSHKSSLRSQTLYTGVDLGKALSSLKSMMANPNVALPTLNKLGKAAYIEGGKTEKEWRREMENLLGDMYPKYKSQLDQVWGMMPLVDEKKGGGGNPPTP